MARSDDQKRKLLYLRELLEQQSDENHPLSTQYILEYLAERGIQAERKSIYSDIACLTSAWISARGAAAAAVSSSPPAPLSFRS